MLLVTTTRKKNANNYRRELFANKIYSINMFHGHNANSKYDLIGVKEGLLFACDNVVQQQRQQKCFVLF